MKHFKNLAYGLLVLVITCGISALIVVIDSVEALYIVWLVFMLLILCYSVGFTISEIFEIIGKE